MNCKFLLATAFSICMCTYTKIKADEPASQPAKVVTAPLKIGYVDTNHILEHLPEAKQNMQNLKTLNQQLSKQIEMKQQELSEQYKDLESQMAKLTQEQKERRVGEYRKLEGELEALHRKAERELLQKQQDTIVPLINRMHEVIQQVAQECGYTFVFTKEIPSQVPMPIVLFADKTFDLTEMVLEKLKAAAPKGIEAPVVAAKVTKPAAEPKKQQKAKTNK